MIALSGILFGLKEKQVHPLFAEGEETSEVEDTSSSEQEELSSYEEPTEQVEESKQDNEITEKIKQFKDTYLVPILSGVSVTSILSAVFTISLSLINRNTNKKISEANATTQANVVKALEIAEAKISATIEYVNKMCALVNKTIEQAEATKQIGAEMFDMLKAKYSELLDEVKDLTDSTEKMLVMKKCMVMLINIEAELAKTNPHAISSGVVKQIAAINEEAKKML